MKRLPLFLVLAAILAGCAAATPRPPKAGPEEVRFYNPNAAQHPPAGYRTIGPIRVERPMGTADAELYLALRAEAARLGADAVILRSVRRSTEGDASMIGRDERVIAEGIAVYWPDPQP
jgi:hypothetical protein